MQIELYNIYELLIKGIPETLLVVYGMFILTKSKLSLKQYSLICFIHLCGTYIFRSIHIRTGAITVISLFLLVLAFVFIIKTTIQKTVLSAFILTILLVISECLNLILLQFYYNIPQLETMLAEPLKRSIYGIPSTIIFGCLILIMKLLIVLKKERKTIN